MFLVARIRTGRLGLESEAQPPFDHPRGSQAKHTRSVADTERVALRGSFPGLDRGVRGVDRTGSGRAEVAGLAQPAADRARREVVVGKVEDVEEAHAGLNREAISELVNPAQAEIKGLDPGEGQLIGGSIGQGRRHGSDGL